MFTSLAVMARPEHSDRSVQDASAEQPTRHADRQRWRFVVILLTGALGVLARLPAFTLPSAAGRLGSPTCARPA